MSKNIIIAILLAVIIGGAAWFYIGNVYHTPIGKVIESPRDYDDKTVFISGKVKDRISLLVVKYFVLQDSTGEIVVITRRAMPVVGSSVRVKGMVREAYSIGDEQMIVLIEETDEPEK